MLDINVSVDSIKKLDKHIKYVEKMMKLKYDIDFQKYIQDKCLQTVKKVAEQRIYSIPTSNEDMKSAYIQNNKIRKEKNGFVIYNDLSVQNKNYTFCVALAFEYGTGLIGQEQAINGAWAYNINQNTVFYDGEIVDGWWLSKDKAGNVETFGESKSGKDVITRGYRGMEIYRFSAEEIKSMLPKWVNDYLSRNEV